MLKLVTDISELSFLTDGPFEAVITALAKTYGTGTSFAKFYIQDNKSALSILDGNVNLFTTEDTDFEEIREFLDMLGYTSVRGTTEALKNLKYEISDTSYIVKYQGADVSAPEHFTDRCEIKDIFSLLVSSGFELGSFEAFVSDVCSRINKGAASFGCITNADCNKPLSVCFRLFDGKKSLLLGAVATDKAARGQGLAGTLVPYMTDKNKPSYLFTRNDSLLEFYKKCGFKMTGKWAITYKEG